MQVKKRSELLVRTCCTCARCTMLLSALGAVCRALQGCEKPGKAGKKDLALAWVGETGCGTGKAEPIAQHPEFILG